MSRAKGGLGRGLAALIPTGPQTNVVTDVFMSGSVQERAAVGGSRGQDVRQSGFTDDDERQVTEPASDEDLGASEATSRRTGRDEGSNSASSSFPARSSASPDGNIRKRPVPNGGTEDQPTGPRYEEVPIGQIRPNPRNPRTVFDEDALAELEHSVREFGLLQPIILREISGGYELVMGERRWRAAQRAGLHTIPAIVRRTEDAALLRDALLENIHRANLNPLEEAAAYQQLLEEFGVTQEELATKIGRSRPVISNTIRLLKLPLAVQRRVAAGVLSAGHARALLSLDDPSDQEELATRVVAQGLSVRGTEEAVVLMVGRTIRPKRVTPKKLMMPSLELLADSLSDTFDTRVRVELGRQKGRMIVEFATVDDLERIVGLMAPAALEKSRNTDDHQ